MDTKIAIHALEQEWDLESGFLGKLRMGVFDPDSLERLLQKLSAIQMRDDNLVHLRLVSLLWYIPLFMIWQRERLQSNNVNLVIYDYATSQVTSMLENILGLP